MEHVFLHRGWVEYDTLVISSNFWMDGFTRNSKTTFIGILYTACIKRLIRGRWNFRVAFCIFKYLQITISVLEFWL